jgi:hypothetical protein
MITLVVRDGRQRVGRASATLIVTPGPLKFSVLSPVALIKPSSIRVPQGDRVRFFSTSYHPDASASIARLQWRSQWGQTSTGNSMEIDTGSMNPGTYWVALDVIDQREQRDSARATLEVVAVAAAPPIARISPITRKVQQGVYAEFDGSRSIDRDGRIRSWTWTLNDKRIDGKPSARIRVARQAPRRCSSWSSDPSSSTLRSSSWRYP